MSWHSCLLPLQVLRRSASPMTRGSRDWQVPWLASPELGNALHTTSTIHVTLRNYILSTKSFRTYVHHTEYTSLHQTTPHSSHISTAMFISSDFSDRPLPFYTNTMNFLFYPVASESTYPALSPPVSPPSIVLLLPI